MSNEWTITYMDGDVKTVERVSADGWQIGPAGDLAFVNEPYGSRPFYLRAYAAGTWLTVDLYT